MSDFADFVIVITGASSGIGAATAEAFSKHGACLSLTGRDEGRLKKAADKCQENGLKAEQILLTSCDLAEASSVDLIIKRTVDKFGRIDVLVNNAGYDIIRPFEAVTMEELDKEYYVMLRAPFFLSQKAMPYLKERKGCIINISSCGSTMAVVEETSYCVLKAAVDHLTRVLAMVGAESGVRVNSVNPGMVKTSVLAHGGVTGEKETEYFEAARQMTPLGRVAEPSEIASTIVYLATPSASFITGINLVQDGGAVLASTFTGLSAK